MPTTPALRMTHISKTYGTGSSQVQALRDVSLSIERGTLTLILGPSGSGKSTFLTIAGGLQTPDSGEISIDGQPMNALSKRAQDRLRLKNIGFILQGHDLVPYLTVMEQFQLVYRVKPKGNMSKNELLQLLKDLGVDQLANSLPRDMSGGQQQRVAIARALYTKPSLVLADEPTSALDSHSVEVVGELLQSVAHSQNTAMVVVTHDTRLVTLADDVYDMEDGVLTHREH